MGRLCYFVIANVVFIGMLLCVRVTEATGQDAITSLASESSDLDLHNNFNIKANNSHCKCVKYDCGCCQYLIWNSVFLDGKLCFNISYLEYDYGFSLTVTYNNFAIFNETISARNPPPICFGEDIIEALDVEVCLRIYDIDVTNDKFHACFQILGKIMKLPITKVQLGCIQTKLRKKIEYVENNLSSLFRKKKNTLPNVIMV